MAYLVPAALFAVQRGERVVVSTNTINLQDQLYAKDIPDVQRMLADAQATASGDEPPVLKAALLKGRSNYLCPRRYRALLAEDNLHPHEARALLKVHFWLPTTLTGDRAELLLVERENVTWERINSMPEHCSPQQCGSECFFQRARRRADAAHIVVVNHALLLADMAAQSNVLPAYQHLIIDEAHNLEEVATDQLGFRLSQNELLLALDALATTNPVGGLLAEILPQYLNKSTAEEGYKERAERTIQMMHPAIESARRAAYDLFNQLQAFVVGEITAQSSYDARLRITPATRRKPEWATIEQVWDNARLALTSIGEGMGQLETLLIELEDADIPDYEELHQRVEWLKRSITDIRVQSSHIVLGDEESISWISYDPLRQALTLNAAPLNVADILQGQLFAEKQTSILTSATLSVNESFAFVRERLGLYEPEERQLDSPFNYEQQAMVYIPTDMPLPNQQGYQQSLERALIDLCRATEGRALVLFTATSSLRLTYENIQEPLEDLGITVLAQGIDGSRRSLLERFKEWPRTVLLGTSSFWEGVDVAGDALSVLVIAKLPFSVPNDPVFAARSEAFSDPFLEYAVPNAVLRFKQGFGRLIRSKDDRGVVVMLDRRLISKRYGELFLQSLPPTSVRTGTLKQLAPLTARFLAARNGTNRG
jgi:DNA polymerase-3 subunit epsilon/ATP-dependent DNA helicase DinG